MQKHLIRLAFDTRVERYEEKIAHIAACIKKRFGERVDVELPLSKCTTAAKLIYLQADTFEEARALADEIKSFLGTDETVRYLNTANIKLSTVCIDDDYARGWRGTFAQRFDFHGL